MKDEGEGPTVRVRVTGAKHSIKQLVHVCVSLSLSFLSRARVGRVHMRATVAF